MRNLSKKLGAAVGLVVVLAACGLGSSRAMADDVRVKVAPAVQTVTSSGNPQASVQLVQWGRPYGYGYSYGGYARPYYGGGYYSPFYRPYHTPYYPAYPRYSGYGYGYGYPTYGYGYAYPAYGGIGIRAGGVGVGIW